MTKGALVIAGRDLRSYFMSPLFYVISGICSFIWWGLFSVRLGEFVHRSRVQMQMGDPSAEQGMSLHYYVTLGHFSIVNFVMLLVAGAITMRLFAEEKKNRTFDLLLTSPVTATDIAVGKLLAGVGIAWALVLVSCVFPASVAFFGETDWGSFASSLIGILLISAVYISIGMFASSIAGNVAIAVVLGLIMNLTIWFFGVAAETETEPTARAIWEYLSVGAQFQDFVLGSVTIKGFAFFLSMVAFFTFLTQRVVESTRWR